MTNIFLSFLYKYEDFANQTIGRDDWGFAANKKSLSRKFAELNNLKLFQNINSNLRYVFIKNSFP